MGILKVVGAEHSFPSIGVIVPNFNDSRFIDRCLTSVLCQEVLPDELIIVDDASTDESVSRIKRLISECSYSTLILNPENLGVYGAVDRGLERCSCEYVLFLSANDFILPGLIKRAKAGLKKHPTVGLWSAMGWLVDEQNQPIKVLPQAVPSMEERYFSSIECHRMASRYGNWFVGPSVVYRRTTLDEVGRFDPHYRGLSDLISALCVSCAQGAVFCPEPLAAFRMHSGSYLGGTLESAQSIETILKRLDEQGPLQAPSLFTSAFLRRIKLRFIFSAIRASDGRMLTHYSKMTDDFGSSLLRTLSYIIPIYFSKLRIIFAFICLRPFDIFPALYNRGIRTAWISFKSNRTW
jgi:glycosyltransferase involved in cell wall biosynthesis